MGKTLTMVYAIIGIPLTSASMIYLGRVITLAIKLLVVTCEECLFSRRKVSRLTTKVACMEIFLCILTLYLVSLYQHLSGLRNHDFFDAVYYTFITITTIGFGDIQFDQTYYSGLMEYEVWLVYILDVSLFLINFALFASIIDSFASWWMEDDKGDSLDNGDEYLDNGDVKQFSDSGVTSLSNGDKKQLNRKNNRVFALNEF